MSGYAIVLRVGGPPITQHELDTLLPTLDRRGPHAHESWCSDVAGVASSLLETGDHRLRARVARVDDRLLVAGHLRLDNRDQFVRALVAGGRRVRPADPDINLFAHGWALWGADLLPRVLGDFSVVVYDADSHTLSAARDAFGVRPLYFARTTTRIVVANTLESVLAVPGVSRALNPDAIADFLAAGLNEDLHTTSFRDVRRLPPGHRITWASSGEVLHRYWTLPAPAEHRLSRSDDYAEQFRELLATAVRDRLRGSAVSILMSGGLDSPALAALASREVMQGSPPTALHLITGRPIRELAAADMDRAQLMASHLSLPHTIVDASRFEFMMPHEAPMLRRPEPYDEPDIALWHEWLSTAARFGPAALYGEDPDTLLRPPDLTVLLRTMPLARLAGDVFRFLLTEHARPHLGLRDSARRALGWGEQPDAGPAWIRAPLRDRRANRIAAVAAVTHPTRPATASALANPLWQSLLEALDAGSHGLPLEVRLPYLDLRVVEFALSVPAIPWTQHKRLLREAMRGLLPDQVRLTPKRGLLGYYEARIADWWKSNPPPFAPTAAIAEFVDIDALPAASRASDTQQMTMQFRLRLLDRWLREQGYH